MSTYAHNVQLTIQGTVPGNTGFRLDVDTVLNYWSNTSAGTVVLSAFLTAWKTANLATWLAAADYSYILETYIVKSLDNPLLADYPEVSGVHGSYNATPGAPAPSINAAFFFLKTFTSGRSSHGGIHKPGLPLAGIEGNEFTSAYQVILNNFLSAFLTSFTDLQGKVWKPMILSRKKSSLVPPPPAVDVQGLELSSSRSFLDKDVGTMRRRKEKTVR